MKLDKQLHITDIEHLMEELQGLLKSNVEVELDIGEVEKVDTASLQALCALQKSLAETGAVIHWQGESKAFSAAADNLGVAEFLGLH
jgi:ABC-type transporter Mla MlaB component